MQSRARTRLAPSPTGALHLGNARTFLVNWALARQLGWQIVLRIDDLDGPRVKRGADRDAIDILKWIGIDWDEGPIYQTQCLDRYRQAWRQLADSGQIYPCRCTRSEILAASQSAPHAEQPELRYPGTCRPAAGRHRPLGFEHPGSDVAWRLCVADEAIEFHDELVGRRVLNVQAEVGDFLIGTKRGTPSYQLAVVVDDAHQQIDRIVRGDDLLSSTPRQRLLYQALDRSPLPLYWHLPLVVGPDGRRLAKRHGDSRLSQLRQRGVPPERVVGLLAEWCGIGPRRELTAAEFLDRFRLDRLPPRHIVCSAEDQQWLSGARD